MAKCLRCKQIFTDKLPYGVFVSIHIFEHLKVNNIPLVVSFDAIAPIDIIISFDELSMILFSAS